MKNGLYVIYDSVAEEGGPVFTAKNDGIALRQYKLLLEKDTPEFMRNDYVLLHVGNMNTSPVEIEGFNVPIVVRQNVAIESEVV